MVSKWILKTKNLIYQKIVWDIILSMELFKLYEQGASLPKPLNISHSMKKQTRMPLFHKIHCKYTGIRDFITLYIIIISNTSIRLLKKAKERIGILIFFTEVGCKPAPYIGTKKNHNINLAIAINI